MQVSLIVNNKVCISSTLEMILSIFQAVSIAGCHDTRLFFDMNICNPLIATVTEPYKKGFRLFNFDGVIIAGFIDMAWHDIVSDCVTSMHDYIDLDKDITDYNAISKMKLIQHFTTCNPIVNTTKETETETPKQSDELTVIYTERATGNPSIFNGTFNQFNDFHNDNIDRYTYSYAVTTKDKVTITCQGGTVSMVIIDESLSFLTEHINMFHNYNGFFFLE